MRETRKQCTFPAPCSERNAPAMRSRCQCNINDTPNAVHLPAPDCMVQNNLAIWLQCVSKISACKMNGLKSHRTESHVNCTGKRCAFLSNSKVVHSVDQDIKINIFTVTSTPCKETVNVTISAHCLNIHLTELQNHFISTEK